MPLFSRILHILSQTVHMARRIKDATLDSRAARLKLVVRPDPYFRSVERGTHLGYRRRHSAAGTWVMRSFAGKNYQTERLAIADDLSDADGSTVLNYWQAVDLIRARIAKLGEVRREAGPTARTTIREALDSYEQDLKARGGDVYSVARVRLHMSDMLITKAVGLVTANDLKTWRNALRSKLAVGSINRIATSLRASLNAVADSDEKINRHAWEVGLSALSDGEVSARNVILSDKQIRNIVAAAYATTSAFGLLVEVAAVTGARYGQLARLIVGDVQANRVMVPRSRKGKGKKPGHTPVAIPASLVLKLKAAGKGKPAHAVLLTKPDGAAWRRSQHTRAFACAVEKAGADPDVVTINALRHSSIVRQLRAQVPIRVVASVHDTSVQMIEAHYSKEIASASDDLTRAALLDLSETRDNVVSIR
jgi:integrase